MSRAQTRGVILTAILSALDGYDVLAMTFAAPSISREWNLDKAALGIALSSGLLGMAMGSLLIAPLADRFGRRRLVIANLLLMFAGMLMAAFSRNLSELVGWRLMTGIGIGGMVPIIAPLAAEFSNSRHRTLAMAAMAIGYPIGGTIGGFGAALLLQWFDWKSVLLLGAGVTALLLLPILLWLPESALFLATRSGPGALDRLNALLIRFGQHPLEAMPPRPDTPRPAPYRAIFSPPQLRTTMTITMINLLYIITVYYVLSWLPQMVADFGHSPSFATMVSAASSFAGSLACVLIGLFAARVPQRVMVPVQMIGLSLTTIAFGFTPGTPTMLLLSGAAVGIFLYTGILGLYSLIVEAFDAQFRATGVGFVMGVGRAAGAIAPTLAGFLFASGASRELVSVTLASAALVAGVLVLRMTPRGARPQ